jgi:hypothetical protein
MKVILFAFILIAVLVENQSLLSGKSKTPKKNNKSGKTFPGKTFPGKTFPGKTFPGKTFPSKTVRFH